MGEVVGTELNHERIKFVTERHGLDMTHPSEVQQKFEPGYFDVITLFHVLEHFVEPNKELERISKLLSDDGILIIEVPNLDDWMLSVSHEYRKFWYQRAHAQFFTWTSLVKLLHRIDMVGNIEFIQRYSIRNMLHWLWVGRPEISEPNKIDYSQLSLSGVVYNYVLKSLKATDTIILSAVSGD